MHPHHYDKHAAAAHAGKTAVTPTTVATGDTRQKARSVSADEIRIWAYRKWESAGKPAGDGTQFWLDAERELVKGK